MEALGWWVENLLPGVIVGVVMAYWNMKQKKRVEAAEEQERDKIKAEKVRLDVEMATAQLAYATAVALETGKVNGEIRNAIDVYNEAMKKFRNMEREQIAKNNI